MQDEDPQMCAVISALCFVKFWLDRGLARASGKVYAEVILPHNKGFDNRLVFSQLLVKWFQQGSKMQEAATHAFSPLKMLFQASGVSLIQSKFAAYFALIKLS